jgi:hypothetical protein
MRQTDFSFIYKYFTAEKQESLVFIIIGIVAIILAVIFFFFIKTNTALFKGAVIPLLVLGIIQLVAGYTVYARSGKQSADIAYNIGLEPVAYATAKEIPRIETVMKNFVIYRWVEIAMAITGIVLFFYFKNNIDKKFWKGFGLTLAAMALLALAADYFAEQRGHVYVNAIKEFIKPKS